MPCGWHHLHCPSHPIAASRWAIQPLSLDHLGWSFTAGDGPESSKCQLSKRSNRCLHWLGGRCGTGWQQQHLLPWFPSAQEATENTAELQLGLSPQAPMTTPCKDRAFDLAEQERVLAPATKTPKAQHSSQAMCPKPQPCSTPYYLHRPAPGITSWISSCSTATGLEKPTCRKDGKGERVVEDRKDIAQSPISSATHIHHLELQPPSGQACDYFSHYEQGKWVKSIL